MDSEKQKALEAAGWRFGDAADFLEMTEEERQLLNARGEAALAVRRQREAQNLSQQQLADRINTSQPRVAKIEQAATDVSLDQILRAFVAAGGRIAVKQVSRTRASKVRPRPSKINRKKTKAGQVGEIEIEMTKES